MSGDKPGCKPLSGGIHGQLMEQGPSYRAGFALDITLGLSKMQQSRFGTISVFFGATALLAAIAFTETERRRNPGVGYLLNWMDQLGLIKGPSPGQIPEWRALGPFDLTDQRALMWVLVYSVCFALLAMILALWSEYKREDSLTRSIGFILGVLALHIYGFQYSMPALMVGATLHAFVRCWPRPNPSIERDVQGLSPSAAPHVKR